MMYSENEEEEDAFLLYAQYYLDILCKANECYKQGDKNVPRALAQLDLEWDNIQQGQTHAANFAEKDTVATVLCIAYACIGPNMLDLRQTPFERIRWFETALAPIQQLKQSLTDKHTNPQDDTLQKEWISNLLRYIISLDDHFSTQDQEILLKEPAAMKLVIMTIESLCLREIGEAYRRQGHGDRARGYQQRALSLGRELSINDFFPKRLRFGEWLMLLFKDRNRRRGDSVKGSIQRNLGHIYLEQGQYQQAMDCYQRALKINRAHGDRLSEGGNLGNLGNVYKHLGQYHQAMDYGQQALTVSRELGEKRMEGNQLGNLGEVCRLLKQYNRAIDYQQQALVIARELVDREGEGKRLGNLGTTYAQSGQYSQATECYQQALDIARELGDRRGEGNRLGNLGNIYILQAEYERGIECRQQELAIAHEVGNRRGAANALLALGAAYLQQRQLELGLECLQQAKAVFAALGVKHKVKEIDRLIQFTNVGFL